MTRRVKGRAIRWAWRSANRKVKKGNSVISCPGGSGGMTRVLRQKSKPVKASFRTKAFHAPPRSWTAPSRLPRRTTKAAPARPAAVGERARRAVRVGMASCAGVVEGDPSTGSGQAPAPGPLAAARDDICWAAGTLDGGVCGRGRGGPRTRSLAAARDDICWAAGTLDGGVCGRGRGGPFDRLRTGPRAQVPRWRSGRQ